MTKYNLKQAIARENCHCIQMTKMVDRIYLLTPTHPLEKEEAIEKCANGTGSSVANKHKNRIQPP